MLSKKTKSKGGFTLIELMITIFIMLLITGIILSYLGAAKARGRDAKRIADIKQLEQAIEVYFSSCNVYPPNLVTLATDCNQNKILASIPTDPLGVSYSYAMANSPTLQYHVCTTLELGYAGGIGKSQHAPISGLTPPDPCDGNLPNVFDRYGPN